MGRVSEYRAPSAEIRFEDFFRLFVLSLTEQVCGRLGKGTAKTGNGLKGFRFLTRTRTMPVTGAEQFD